MPLSVSGLSQHSDRCDDRDHHRYPHCCPHPENPCCRRGQIGPMRPLNRQFHANDHNSWGSHKCCRDVHCQLHPERTSADTPGRHEQTRRQGRHAKADQIHVRNRSAGQLVSLKPIGVSGGHRTSRNDSHQRGPCPAIHGAPPSAAEQYLDQLAGIRDNPDTAPQWAQPNRSSVPTPAHVRQTLTAKSSATHSACSSRGRTRAFYRNGLKKGAPVERSGE